MATRKSPFDWDRIELEYLAGEASIREIADRHEISDTAIRKRAKADGWVRAVRKLQPVRTCEPEPRAPRTPAGPVPDAAVIAERGRGLVARNHRGGQARCIRRHQLELVGLTAVASEE